MNKEPSTTVGTVPLRQLPGKVLEGSPKKYLRGPALVMTQDTARVPAVERLRTAGKDLRCGYQEAPAVIMTRTCWWVR